MYFQWLTNSSDPLTLADGYRVVSLAPFTGGALMQLMSPSTQDLYLGVMCNRATGYEIFLTASNPGTGSNQAELSVAGGTDLQVTVSIVPVGNTFDAGANLSTSIDLTGSTASSEATFQTDAQAPLTAASPNVWKVSIEMPLYSSVADGLLMAGTYSGNITATVVLK